MDFGNACLFNKKPEDMRRVGARGGRARARNLRLRKARQAPVTRERNRPHEETAPRPLGASMPCAPGWSVWSVARHGGDRLDRAPSAMSALVAAADQGGWGRTNEGVTGRRAPESCKVNYAVYVKEIMPHGFGIWQSMHGQISI